ncbi:MAG: pyruvate formate lyase family protein, partial [Anaerolineae bacterium]
EVEQRRCPACQSTWVHRHGSYTRRPYTLSGRQTVAVQRYRCQRCGATYAVSSALDVYVRTGYHALALGVDSRRLEPSNARGESTMQIADPESIRLPWTDRTHSARVARFLAASRRRMATARPSRRLENMAHAYLDLYAHVPRGYRYARALAYTLEREPVYLFDDALLVGMFYQASAHRATPNHSVRGRWTAQSAEARTRAWQARHIEPYLRVGGAPGHVGWRWDLILEQGVEGLMTTLAEHLRTAHDLKARRLYQGALTMWSAVLRWNDRHAAALEAQAAQAHGAERARLERLAALCRRVPRHPARDFHEALQSFYLQHMAVMFENPFGGNGPGRVDLLLWPYLARDLQRGAITLEEAADLVDEMLIRMDERLPNADLWVEAITLGGRRADGAATVNPLSYMLVRSIMALNQTHPAVYLRLDRHSAPEWLDQAADYMVRGGNRAQVFNDDACIPAILEGGATPEDALDYMAGGCMEISVQGAACDSNFTCTHNVAKTLELVLSGGIDLLTGARRIPERPALPHYACFEGFYAAFEAELAREYGVMVQALDRTSANFSRYRPSYLLSSLVHDCLARGREQQDGGARYHDYGFAPLGITAAGDALHALKRAVYDEGFVSAEELLEALRTNYVGRESLRARLARLPRFGMEEPEADAMANRVLGSVCRTAGAPPTRFGGRLKPMIFNFVWTPSASHDLAARADGSLAGELIGHGLTPCKRALAHGITAAMNASSALDTRGVTGGGTTMWDVDERWITQDIMRSLLAAFIARGGMIFQGNTTGVADLQAALEQPERYPHLIVRVGGFSARFTSLSRDVQEEIVQRRRHAS